MVDVSLWRFTVTATARAGFWSCLSAPKIFLGNLLNKVQYCTDLTVCTLSTNSTLSRVLILD